MPAGVSLDVLPALQHVLSSRNPQKPVIVFCMRRADTYALARQFAGLRRAAQTRGSAPRQLPLQFDELPETSANVLLADTLGVGIAVHSADLTEQERNVVERMLLENKLDVVFATTTLAAGVNFPLGTAIFAGWTRWDSARHGRVPIGTSEFHNMAGRVGRMGFEHGRGKVIFFADRHKLPQAKRYLDLDALARLEPRTEQERSARLPCSLWPRSFVRIANPSRTRSAGPSAASRSSLGIEVASRTGRERSLSPSIDCFLRGCSPSWTETVLPQRPSEKRWRSVDCCRRLASIS